MSFTTTLFWNWNALPYVLERLPAQSTNGTQGVYLPPGAARCGRRLVTVLSGDDPGLCEEHRRLCRTREGCEVDPKNWTSIIVKERLGRGRFQGRVQWH